LQTPYGVVVKWTRKARDDRASRSAKRQANEVAFHHRRGVGRGDSRAGARFIWWMAPVLIGFS